MNTPYLFKMRLITFFFFACMLLFSSGCGLMIYSGLFGLGGALGSDLNSDYDSIYDDFYNTYVEYELVEDQTELDSIWNAIPPFPDTLSQESETSYTPNPSIGERYSLGEADLADEVATILMGDNDSLINTNLINLRWSWDLDKPFTNSNIIKAIYHNFENEATQNQAIIAAGSFELPEAGQLMEDLLLGKPEMLLSGTLLYWLGKDGSSEKSVDYLIKKFNDPRLNNETQEEIMSSLGEFLNAGTPAIKKSVQAFMLDYLKSENIPGSKLKVLQDEVWSHPVFDAILSLFSFGDQAVLPLADSILALKSDTYYIEEALSAVFRLNKPDQYKKYQVYLKELDNYELIYLYQDDIFPKTTDGFWIEQLLTNYDFDDPDDYDGYQQFQLAKMFFQYGFTDFEEDLARYTDKPKAKEILGPQFLRISSTPKSISDQLLAFGLIESPRLKSFSEETIKEKGVVYDSLNRILNYLETNNLLLEMESYSETFPLNYDSLFQVFQSFSGNQIPAFELKVAYAEAKNEFSDYEEYEYQLFIRSGSKLLTAKHYDYGDFFDIEITLGLLNRLLKESGIDDQFIIYETYEGEYFQFLYGNKDQWELFFEQYGIPIGIYE